MNKKSHEKWFIDNELIEKARLKAYLEELLLELNLQLVMETQRSNRTVIGQRIFYENVLWIKDISITKYELPASHKKETLFKKMMNKIYKAMYYVHSIKIKG